MSLLFVEVLICFAICFILFRCCGRLLTLNQQQRQQQQQQEQEQEQQEQQQLQNDLRFLREQMTRFRGEVEGRHRPDTVSEDVITARKELILKNLFVRRIHREESVKELAQLLVISRGGGDDFIMEENDEESGIVNGRESSAASNAASNSREQVNRDDESNINPSPKEDDLPLNSACALDHSTSSALVVEDDASTINASSSASAMTVGRLWRSFSRRQQSDPNNLNADPNDQQISPHAIYGNDSCRFSSQITHPNKIECSICLEQYLPNDTIAWAKDCGSDDTPHVSGSTSTYVVCDHIFHKECIVAWLHDHDECPLCRRKVVHADALTRFVGWEERL